MQRSLLAGLTIVICLALAPLSAANELRIGAPTVATAKTGETTTRIVTVDVAWRNGWRTARNHDAVWLFVKTAQAGGGLRHVRLAPAGHRVTSLGRMPGELIVPDDRVGAFVVPAASHRGDVQWRIELVLERQDDGPGEVRVFGLEMVQVPEGRFTLGDPEPVAPEFSAVYRSDNRGEPAGLFQVNSEDAIRVGPFDGALFYRTKFPQYEGDRIGPIPAAFPKGVKAFYAMKYEITQGNYADFLNALPSDATAFRAIHGGRAYTEGRGTIRLEGKTYIAGVPHRPANWISWDDGLAFADWAGLRPMTEFEFTKAARGPGTPIAHEFPWGTGSAERLKRVMGPNDDLVTTGDADEATLTDDTRDVLGASFYWVMDLAGSVWERVITFGHPRGRAFRGSHGDGILGGGGMATNEDWPLGDYDAGGYGYRGGGYYERSMATREFNPYSPIAYRRYGSWGGGPRSIAYGFRAVRTAPQTAPDLPADLKRIAASTTGTLGVSILHVESGARVDLNATEWYPMMSVYKLPIALHALRLAEQGKLDLAHRVTLRSADRRTGLSPLSREIEAKGAVTLTVRDMISSILRVSDNAASDRLLRLVGGPSAVQATLRGLGFTGINVNRYELQFSQDYHRDPAAFERDRRDSVQPETMAQLLVRLVRGELANPQHTKWLLEEMAGMHTRDTRIRAGLPPGTRASLRPGTSGETAGVRAAQNDNAIVVLPDGRGHLVISAFLKGSRDPDAARDATLAAVAGAAYRWILAQR
jgi:beta-lactamase class A/formylglycine-generating enzyme required for sulfatase activity